MASRSGTPPPRSSALIRGSERPNAAATDACRASISEDGPPDAAAASNSRQCTRPPSRLCCDATPLRSTLNGPRLAACSSVKPCKNAANSGWRNSASRIFSAMMTSAARAPEARRPPCAGLRKPPRDRSMLNRADPDCNPRTQNPSDTRKRGATRFHKKWDAPILIGREPRERGGLLSGDPAELGHLRDRHRAGHKPDPRNRPQDGDGFRQGSVGVDLDLDPLLQVLDAPVRNLPELGIDVFELAGRSGLLAGLAMQRMALAHLDKLFALGRQCPENPQRLARQAASGRNAMNRAISSASIRSVLAEVPRLLPNASACAGASWRASVPAASRRSQSRHSWPINFPRLTR